MSAYEDYAVAREGLADAREACQDPAAGLADVLAVPLIRTLGPAEAGAWRAAS